MNWKRKLENKKKRKLLLGANIFSFWSERICTALSAVIRTLLVSCFAFFANNYF